MVKAMVDGETCNVEIQEAGGQVPAVHMPAYVCAKAHVRNVCIRQGKELMWLASMYWHFLSPEGGSGQGAQNRKTSACSLPAEGHRDCVSCIFFPCLVHT